MHHADPTKTSPNPPTPSPGTESASSSTSASEQQELDRFRLALLRQTPRAVFTILFLLGNVAVYLVMVYQNVPPMAPKPETMIEWGANYAPRTLDGELWRLLTCMFLHFGAVHLGMNMLALWSLGRFVERMFGNLGFFLLYLLSGLAGSLASVVVNPTVVSVGASGAIFGVAGGLLGGVWTLRGSMPTAFLRAARWVGLNVLILFVVFSFVNNLQDHAMIDNAAHLGGFLTGLVCGLMLAEPIPNPGGSRKMLRNGLLAATGAAALVLAVGMLPGKPADVGKLELKYIRVEQVVHEKISSANGRLAANAMTIEEYAAFLEREILPRWEEFHQDFAQADNIPAEHRDRMASLLEIIQLKQASLEKKIEAIREQDPNKDRESERLLREAATIIDRLNKEAE